MVDVNADGNIPAREDDPNMAFLRRNIFKGAFCFILLLCVSFGLQIFFDPSQQDARDFFHENLIKISAYLPDNVNELFKSYHHANDDELQRKIQQYADYDFRKGPIMGDELRMMTSSDIKFTEGGPLYLILIGHVFDVSTGGQTYYNPGSGYHGFIGRDASRSFVSGDFSEPGLIDNLEGLEPNDYTELLNWMKFYLTHYSYKFVGYHVGRYYNEDRTETDEMQKLKGWIIKAYEDLDKEGDLLKLFPSCNVQWTEKTGSEVWCSQKSGGIDRDWIGYPRNFFEPGKQARCACVHPNYLADPRVKEYDECKSTSARCKLNNS